MKCLNCLKCKAAYVLGGRILAHLPPSSHGIILFPVLFPLLIHGEVFAKGLGAGRDYRITGPVTFLVRALGTRLYFVSPSG